MTVIEQLAKFIEEHKDSYIASEWLSDEHMQVYVRRGRRSLISNAFCFTLDIANVVVEEGSQRQGRWSEFLEKAHEMNPWDATFVECVHNPILITHLAKLGWYIQQESFFMPKDTQKFFEEQKARNFRF